MIKSDPQLSFSSVDAIRHSSVDLKALVRNGQLKVDGATYRVQLSPDGEFKVQREGRSSVSPGRFFKAAGEMFSHRLNDGAASSRSNRIADALNAKAWPAERQAPARAPANGNPARVHPMANQVEPAQVRQPSSQALRGNILKQIEDLPRSNWEGPIKALERLDAKAATLPAARTQQLFGQLNSIMGIRDSGTRNARLEQFSASLSSNAPQGREQVGRPQNRTEAPAARPQSFQGRPAQNGGRVFTQPSPTGAAQRPLTPEHFMREEHARAAYYNERPSERRAEQEYSRYMQRLTQQSGAGESARPQSRPQVMQQSPGNSSRTQMEARTPQRTLEDFNRDEEARARYHGEEPNYDDARRAFDAQQGSSAARRKPSSRAEPPSATPVSTASARPAATSAQFKELSLFDFEQSEEKEAEYNNERPDYQRAQRNFEEYQARLKEGNR